MMSGVVLETSHTVVIYAILIGVDIMIRIDPTSSKVQRRYFTIVLVPFTLPLHPLTSCLQPSPQWHRLTP
jgi:hypothetical protein